MGEENNHGDAWMCISGVEHALYPCRNKAEKLDDGWPESEKDVFSSSSEYGSRKK